jgi:hypothetical protein
MTEIPVDPVAAVALARDALEHAASIQADIAHPTRQQFTAYGELLTRTMSELESLTVVLAGQVARYGDQFVPDEDRLEPIERLQRTVRHLTELAEVLHTAALHANGFWSEIGSDPATGDDKA